MGSWEGSWNSSVTSRSLSFMRRGNFSMSAERGGEGRGGEGRGETCVTTICAVVEACGFYHCSAALAQLFWVDPHHKGQRLTGTNKGSPKGKATK